MRDVTAGDTWSIFDYTMNNIINNLVSIYILCRAVWTYVTSCEADLTEDRERRT